MKTLLKLSLGTVLAAGTLSAEAGPIGTYYLTDYVANKLQAIQGDTIMSNAEGDQYEGPIAIVGSSIRTTSIHFSAAGSEYVSAPDLSVTLTGNAYANSIGDAIYDGTTDGSHNYTVSFENNTVYRTNTDWSNPVALFTLSTPFYIGITYDNSNNSLWLSNFNYGLIIDVAMDGTVLSSFTMATSTLTSALAMDLDHTLWLDAYDDSGNLLHYATDGTYLGSEHYSGLRYALGGEIMAAPEPASLALFGVGAMGLLRRYRKNQKA